MGITIFKIFIWGGISSDIRSEITFYGSAYFEYSYPLNVSVLGLLFATKIESLK